MERIDLRENEPHSARVYDYLLGGKDNYPPDREVGERMIEASPGIRETVRANRRFMVRSARYLAKEAGIRQFLDVGTGLPTSPNLHEVVQEVDPTAHVVYVDNDPMVLVNARALLVSSPEGMTTYVDADLREPGSILGAPGLLRVLDMDRPVAVSLIAVLHFVTDQDVALGIISRLVEPLASGSALTISVLTPDGVPDQMAGVQGAASDRGIPSRPRTRTECEEFFSGLDLLEPGVTRVGGWRPDAGEDPAGPDVPVYGAVAFKR